MTALEKLDVPRSAALDPIAVFWEYFDLGKGQVTITCWGSAWTAYFGGMGDGTTIKQFFSDADTDYLVTKLGSTQFLKQTKLAHAYLARIVDAIKAELLRAGAPAEVFRSGKEAADNRQS